MRLSSVHLDQADPLNKKNARIKGEEKERSELFDSGVATRVCSGIASNLFIPASIFFLGNLAFVSDLSIISLQKPRQVYIDFKDYQAFASVLFTQSFPATISFRKVYHIHLIQIGNIEIRAYLITIFKILYRQTRETGDYTH